MIPTERLLRYFDCQHLPDKLKMVSAPFGQMALFIENKIPDGPEKTVCLRKLLESKDCAVRAALDSED